jgi:hypothetical protein
MGPSLSINALASEVFHDHVPKSIKFVERAYAAFPHTRMSNAGLSDNPLHTAV